MPQYVSRSELHEWVDENMLDSVLLSADPDAIDYLMAHPEKIDYTGLCINTNPRAIEILREHVDNIVWHWLSINPTPEAVRLALEHQNMIHWDQFSANTNPDAISILARPENLRKIHYERLRGNIGQGAMELMAVIDADPELLEITTSNSKKINWYALSYNPPIHMSDLASSPEGIFIFTIQNEMM